MNDVRLRACAKVNLFLEILGRRPDGYHELSTLFQEISLADELTVERDPRLTAEDYRLACSDPALSAGPDNLVAKAFRAFQARPSKTPGEGYRFTLKKRIPVGAGLGGGSSDAAAALKAMWRLGTGRPLSDFPWRRFVPLARRLGADVSFFLRGGLSEARGVGEVLKPVLVKPAPGRPVPPVWMVLVFPRVFVQTKWVYQRLRFPLTKFRSIRTLKVSLSQGRPVHEWAPFIYNRLEDVVLPRVPAVARAKKALMQAGCRASLMSGSGSSVFGLVDSSRIGKRVMEKLRSSEWNTWLVRSVDVAQRGLAPQRLVAGRSDDGRNIDSQ
ncbi:MAG: 4-(cytidine 5'-diphospho)-2-C-methyl-D-erythritol kinase [Elusimicrobia bacterium]|nr:4-(cytidine 5'-diphospho)-2-C-methyl-D-erythritol kinase [Elusimicrobiota bacterium]